MAQQCGPVFITGTIDDVCFYRMDGKYYVRMKSSLTRKRVMQDPAFRRTREHAALLGAASKIASKVYHLITGERKKHALYREMTGKAIHLLREGKDKETVFQCLCNQYLEPEPVEEPAHEPYKKVVIKGQWPRSIMQIEAPVPELRKTMDIPLLRVRRRRRIKRILFVSEKKGSGGKGFGNVKYREEKITSPRYCNWIRASYFYQT